MSLTIIVCGREVHHRYPEINPIDGAFDVCYSEGRGVGLCSRLFGEPQHEHPREKIVSPFASADVGSRCWSL